MITKMFEVRDSGTFIPVIAIKAAPPDEREVRLSEEGQKLQESILPHGTTKVDWRGRAEAERYLLRRAGYGFDHPSIILVRAYCPGTKGNASYDAFSWPADGTRTMHIAHRYIEERFDSMETGEVVDVEYILGEKPTKKTSERIEHPE